MPREMSGAAIGELRAVDTMHQRKVTPNCRLCLLLKTAACDGAPWQPLLMKPLCLVRHRLPHNSLSAVNIASTALASRTKRSTQSKSQHLGCEVVMTVGGNAGTDGRSC